MFEDEEEKTKTAEDQSFFLFITGTFTGNLSGCPDSGHFLTKDFTKPVDNPAVKTMED